MGKDTDIFYINQATSMAATYTDPSYQATAETWMQEDSETVNSARLQRIASIFDPIIKHYQGTEWLTVGDGRFGSDAHFLDKKGVNATATDIQDDLLKVGFDRKFIRRYSKQNAEQLTYSDDSFDFSFCKEAYHHFPRPALAVYEMLRVSRTGIILHEPKDIKIFDDGPIHAVTESVKRWARSLMNKRQNGDDYEISGNYLYSLSKREIEKMALGLNYHCVAFHLLQDHYIEGIEFEKSHPQSKIEKKLNRIIRLKEILFKLGLYNGGLLTAVIFKQKPDELVINDLQKFGYEVTILPKNPYINNN